VKAIVLGTLNARGWEVYLERQADDTPVACMALLAISWRIRLADGGALVTLRWIDAGWHRLA
jgi:hypothetical protein